MKVIDDMTRAVSVERQASERSIRLNQRPPLQLWLGQFPQRIDIWKSQNECRVITIISILIRKEAEDCGHKRDFI